MMMQLLRIRAIFALAMQRLLAQPLLSSATVVGLSVAIALILTIPIYSESVAFRILTERLVEQSENVNRPPFSYLINYIGAWHEPVEWEDTIPLDNYVQEQFDTDLGLNTTMTVKHVETINFRFFPADETDYTDETSLDYMTFTATENIEEHVSLVEGAFPAPAAAHSDGVVEVMITRDFADEFGIQVGNHFLAYNWRLEADDVLQITEVQVAGIWQPLDATSSSSCSC